MATALAALVRMWRERSMLTQEQLARKTGLGVRTIRRLESQGLLRPRVDSVQLLAEALKLEETERAILFAMARGFTVETARQVPRQLLASPAGFTGRESQLQKMDALLAGGGSVCVLTGKAGVGKTALALHWAHRVAKRFSDGQLFANLAASGPRAAIRAFLNAMGDPAKHLPHDLDELSAHYRSLVAGRRMLLLLDNASDADQVRPLLPGTPGCIAVVMSQDQLAGLVAEDGAHPILINELSKKEAFEMLARRIGAARPAVEPEAAAELLGLCAGLPRAIATAAALAATQPGLTLTEVTTALLDHSS